MTAILILSSPSNNPPPRPGKGFCYAGLGTKTEIPGDFQPERHSKATCTCRVIENAKESRMNGMVTRTIRAPRHTWFPSSFSSLDHLRFLRLKRLPELRLFLPFILTTSVAPTAVVRRCKRKTFVTGKRVKAYRRIRCQHQRDSGITLAADNLQETFDGDPVEGTTEN